MKNKRKHADARAGHQFPWELMTSNKRKRSVSLQMKMTLSFVGSSIIILIVNLFMYVNINNVLGSLDGVYQANVTLNELSHALDQIQRNMEAYLNTKTTDSMDAYYRSLQDYQQQTDTLSGDVTSDPLSPMERTIKNMSSSYLDLTDLAVEAKRGRNVEKYKGYYEEATQLYDYIGTYIYSLNNLQFQNNSVSYEALAISLRSLEVVSNLVLAVVIAGNILLVMILARTITRPLKTLAVSANEVAGGNLDIELLEMTSTDEVGVVTKAFNHMIYNIRLYIEQIKEIMEEERAMKEKELLMETHLKDAQLRYLQAQINPHFLFNTLNAGAQLAMLEGADRTYQYVQNMADFFRYNVKKNNEVVKLKEEIDLVDSYIYILNVRFADDIHFEKSIDEACLEVSIPSMILQPIVENSVNHGICGMEGRGRILLTVNQCGGQVCISIIDNGSGVTAEKLERIMSGTLNADEVAADSGGIGLGNVRNRLELFTGLEICFEMESGGACQGTRTNIYLPFKEAH